MKKNLIRILINTAIGAVLIYFWLKIVNVNEVLKALEDFNPWILVPAVIAFGMASIFKALRFKLLLKKEVDVPIFKMINLTFLSQLLSFIIPLRLGELTKGVYLSSEYKIFFGKAVVWTFLDRFLDFWAIIVLSALFLLIVPTFLPATLTQTLFIGSLIASISVILIVLRPNYFKHLVKVIAPLLILKSLKLQFIKVTDFMIDCFALLKGSTKRNLGLLVLTVAGTFAEGYSWYLLFNAFNPVPLLKVWLGSMLVALTFLIPAAPGYVGSAEAAGLAVFSFGLGLNEIAVSAVTIIFHAIGLVFILTTGLFGLYMLKFNLNLVWEKLRKTK